MALIATTPNGRKTARGFTLVEIMITLAIVAMLAAIALPGYMRSRMRSQATMVLEELRVLDAALELYSHEHSLPSGTSVPFDYLRPYLKAGTSLYETGNDLVGNPHGPFAINVIPTVHPDTFTEFEPVADAGFWSPYFRDPEE